MSTTAFRVLNGCTRGHVSYCELLKGTAGGISGAMTGAIGLGEPGA